MHNLDHVAVVINGIFTFDHSITCFHAGDDFTACGSHAARVKELLGQRLIPPCGPSHSYQAFGLTYDDCARL